MTRESENWVQCDLCDRWRKITSTYDSQETFQCKTIYAEGCTCISDNFFAFHQRDFEKKTKGKSQEETLDSKRLYIE
jgi:hypothetical protein